MWPPQPHSLSVETAFRQLLKLINVFRSCFVDVVEDYVEFVLLSLTLLLLLVCVCGWVRACVRVRVYV